MADWDPIFSVGGFSGPSGNEFAHGQNDPDKTAWAELPRGWNNNIPSDLDADVGFGWPTMHASKFRHLIRMFGANYVAYRAEYDELVGAGCTFPQWWRQQCFYIDQMEFKFADLPKFLDLWGGFFGNSPGAEPCPYDPAIPEFLSDVGLPNLETGLRFEGDHSRAANYFRCWQWGHIVLDRDTNASWSDWAFFNYAIVTTYLWVAYFMHHLLILRAVRNALCIDNKHHRGEERA